MVDSDALGDELRHFLLPDSLSQVSHSSQPAVIALLRLLCHRLGLHIRRFPLLIHFLTFIFILLDLPTELPSEGRREVLRRSQLGGLHHLRARRTVSAFIPLAEELLTRDLHQDVGFLDQRLLTEIHIAAVFRQLVQLHGLIESRA